MNLKYIAHTSAFAVAALLTLANTAHAAARFSLAGHIPNAVSAARSLGSMPTDNSIALALTLPLRNEAELDQLIQKLHDPASPLYGKYLTPQEFTQRFGPTQGQYQAAIAFARANGFVVTKQHSNRMLLEVNASAQNAGNAFEVRLQRYQQASGRVFFAPDREPSLPTSMKGVIANIVGLDNSAVWEPHNFAVTPANIAQNPNQIGTGPGGGMSPNDIRAAYGLTGAPQTGVGQTMGLFQLDGYTASDIAGYAAKYNLPNIPLQNVLVGGATGVPATSNGQSEVTLDIELQMALAPGASKIVVYEAPNSNAGILACYNQIATDNVADCVSSSWGMPEIKVPYNILDSENAIFKQMAAQGQSMFAASGDCGAYDNGSALTVEDPAGQPYVTSVGGTHLTTTGAGGAWSSESVWSNTSDKSRSSYGAGSGGGASFYWEMPSYQTGVASAASTSMRNVPDVALAADPGTGYSVYFKGGWYIYGGTSCAAPLWSAFAALVNEQRTANGQSPLGFANPALYAIAKGSRYSADFHDVVTGNNLYYPAVTGYDAATGLGSFNGANLLADLASTPSAAPTTAPPGPASLQATPGNSQVVLTWAPVSGATSYKIYQGTTASGEATTPITTGVLATSVTQSGLTNNTTYYYKVTAVTATGESLRSPEASAMPISTQTGVSLNPVADSYVVSQGGDTVHGSETQICVKRDNVSASTYRRVAYLKFDLTGVTGQITSAQLSLTANANCVATTASAPLSIYAVSNTTWTDSTLTWNNALTGANLTSDSLSTGTLVATATASPKAGVVTWDLTSYLAGKAGQVVTLQIADAGTDGNYFCFNSKEAASGKPVLALQTQTGSTSAPVSPTPPTTGGATLPAIADSYVVSQGGATVHGSETQICVKRDNISTSTYRRVAYLKFDLTSLSGPITSAQLSLTANANCVATTTSAPLSVYGVSNTTWTDSTLTWTNALTGASLTSDTLSTGTLITTTNASPKAGVVTWDLTSYLAGKAGQVVTLQIADAGTDGNYFCFNSKEAASGQPTLTIKQ